MKIVKCKFCKQDILDTIRRCPHCDSQGPRRTRRINRTMLGLLIFITLIMIYIVYTRMQERVYTREEVEEARRIEKIYNRLLSANFFLRTSVADPSTIIIDHVTSNADGSILCYHFSMKRRDHSLVEKRAVFTEGDFHFSPGSLRIYCDERATQEIPDRPALLRR